MNTYQSPYIDGQVLEESDADRDRAAASPLAMTQPDSKINGCTRTASDCLHKTTKLAREFNHGTVSAAHLVLAMTLIPNASRHFDGKADIDKAFRAAMQALMDIERGSPVNGVLPSLSAEFKTIVTIAQELARKREQEVSLDDLFNALDRLPSDSPGAQLLRGEARNGAGSDTRQLLDQLALLVNQQFQEIRRQLGDMRMDQQPGDLSRLKLYLENRDGELEQLIKRGFVDLANRLTPPSPDSPEPVPQAAPAPGSPPDEDSLWEKIFGRKAASAEAAEPQPVQVRWSL